MDLGSGCDSVGRAVASDTRGPRIESSHWQNILNMDLLSTVLKKRKQRKKRPGLAHLKKHTNHGPTVLAVESQSYFTCLHRNKVLFSENIISEATSVIRCSK